MYPMISAFTWFRVFALIYITYHPDSRIREHLKFGGYSRRCQHGSSEIGSHRVRAIFPGPHLSAPPARPCLPSPACGQRGTTPETRLGSLPVSWAPPPNPQDLLDHAPMACVPWIPMPWQGETQTGRERTGDVA
jgi:hypothetical protein